MKKFSSIVAIAIALCLASCSTPFDDSDIWEKLDEHTESIEDHEERISALEELCEQMNTNISALQTIVEALENNDYVTNIVPIVEDGVEIGYTITFSNSQSITIYHGQKGANGADGDTPQIGVKQDTDGIYYWTLDGEWLLDESGNKIKAVGTDGKDGQNGADGEDGKDGNDGQNGTDGKNGITPQLKIENDYWYVSYDNGATWVQLCKVKGETGGSIFHSVTQDESMVYFTFYDGTVITVYKNPALDIIFDTASLQDVKVNSEVKVNYEITGSAEHIDIELLPTNDLRAILVAEDESNKRGYILIRTGSTFDAASRVVVLVSDGNKAIMKSLVLNVKPEEESAQLYVYSGATKSVSAKGGVVTLSFLTNVDCQAVIPAEYQNWISVAESRVLECKHITLSVAENTGERRSANVEVQTADGKMSITYTIVQAGVSSSSNPEVGGDGSILGTPASNEIFYTSSVGMPIEPSATAFNGIVLSNTYENGVGVIVLDRPITIIKDGALSDYYDGYGYANCLTNIVLPDSVTSIGNSAFSGCSRLTSITIPDSVTSIGDDAFSGCSSLTSVTIGNGVTEIGTYAFQYCSSLTSITIPDSVTSIGWYAFEDCTSLTSVTIGNGVTEIGMCAFQYCSSLTSVTIGNGVTEIGTYAFQYCSSLTSVTIGNGVTSIEYMAFYKCTSLTSVTIGNSVTSIGSKAFSNCSSLAEITLPDSVKSIGEKAFYNCGSLTKIEMGSGLNSIKSEAFWGCYFLGEIYCKAATPPTGYENMFVCVPLDAKIYVPHASVEAYKSAQYWSSYASYIEGYDF